MSIDGNDYMLINQGFHSYSCKYRDVMKVSRNPNIHHNLVLMNCIIPKGATYYLNERGDYVSKLIPVSIEEFKET